MASVPPSRVRILHDAPLRPDGEFVLYWMVAARRPWDNFALQHARDLAQQLGQPLYVLEPLRIDYPHASPRLHAFVLQGMGDNLDYFAGTDAFYHPYVEPERGASRGLFDALAQRAGAVVADDYPSFFLPRMLQRVAERCPVRFDAVDGHGLWPLRHSERLFPSAHTLRRAMQRSWLQAPPTLPEPEPLARGTALRPCEPPPEVLRRWAPATAAQLDAAASFAQRLPLAGQASVCALRGGHRQAQRQLERFMATGLLAYLDRNHPDDDAGSKLSPYLHFGHIAAHRVVRALWEREDWSPERLADRANGSREGFWGMGPEAEAFIDQVVTWRELGHQTAAKDPHHADYASVPDWAQQSLAKHAADERPYLYDLAQFEAAETHDEIWNAAQRELRQTGLMHNYMRMLWGKKILHWTQDAEQALQTMITLNDRYALDGRDPNSYEGMLWVLGRHDRAWGPERPIFGKVRYMTSDSAARKLRLSQYVQRFGAD